MNKACRGWVGGGGGKFKPSYVTSINSISNSLAFEIERIVGKLWVEWEKDKLEPLCSLTEGRNPAEILR